LPDEAAERTLPGWLRIRHKVPGIREKPSEGQNHGQAAGALGDITEAGAREEGYENVEDFKRTWTEIYEGVMVDGLHETLREVMEG
jgi:hypothetical protein